MSRVWPVNTFHLVTRPCVSGNARSKEFNSTCAYSIQNAVLSQIAHPSEGKFPIQQLDWLQVTKKTKQKKTSMYLLCI